MKLYLTDSVVGHFLQNVDSSPLRDATVREQHVVVVATQRTGEATERCRMCCDENAIRLSHDVVWVTLSMKELRLELDFSSGVDDEGDGCLHG